MYGKDADVGCVEDVYFDDTHWVVRHLVVDSRHWLRDRHVLIPPAAVVSIDDSRKQLDVALTRLQVEHSPPIDTAQPVSRQHHVDVCSYFGFPYDWTGPALRRDRLAGVGDGDPHLRSARALMGYTVRIRGREIGAVEDFLIDTSSWSIHDVVARAGRRQDDSHLLVSPSRIRRVSWAGRLLEIEKSHPA
jgi:sporulation protein YlmC with PRC-barrel domain